MIGIINTWRVGELSSELFCRFVSTIIIPIRIPFRYLRSTSYIVYTLALQYSLYRYIGPKVYAIWVHGPLGPPFKGILMFRKERPEQAHNSFSLSTRETFTESPQHCAMLGWFWTLKEHLVSSNGCSRTPTETKPDDWIRLCSENVRFCSMPVLRGLVLTRRPLGVWGS